jgi:hypothetical protein
MATALHRLQNLALPWEIRGFPAEDAEFAEEDSNREKQSGSDLSRY